MNSTPADSNAERILIPVSSLPPSGPSWASSRLIVGTETSAAAAKSSCDQAKRDRAALTCRIDTFGIDPVATACDTFSIEMIEAASMIPGEAAMAQTQSKTPICSERRYFIGGSDARIIMGNDEAALVRLWRVKRGEVEPEDLSGNLIVQLGVVTEE